MHPKHFKYDMIYCRDDELQDDEPDPVENTKETDTAIGNDPSVATKKGKKAKKAFTDLDWYINCSRSTLICWGLF